MLCGNPDMLRDAAAALAEKLSRIVQRVSVMHGGRPVKWLGDGVMFHFPDPGSGVVAAIEMVESLATAGLPPAHVGLHAGPIIVQEGDFYGQTVNLAAGARPGRLPLTILRPFIHRTKADICRLGASLKVPFEFTYSCYEGEGQHCGRCGTCVERREAFALAGVPDPTDYAAHVEA